MLQLASINLLQFKWSSSTGKVSFKQKFSNILLSKTPCEQQKMSRSAKSKSLCNWNTYFESISVFAWSKSCIGHVKKFGELKNVQSLWIIIVVLNSLGFMHSYSIFFEFGVWTIRGPEVRSLSLSKVGPTCYIRCMRLTPLILYTNADDESIFFDFRFFLRLQVLVVGIHRSKFWPFHLIITSWSVFLKTFC